MSIDTEEASSTLVPLPSLTEKDPHLNPTTAPREGDKSLLDNKGLLDIRPVRGRNERVTSKANGNDPFKGGPDWPVIAWFGFLHLAAFSSIFLFTWKAVALFAVMSWLTGSIGVCLGYHRMLTHGSLQTYR